MATPEQDTADLLRAERSRLVAQLEALQAAFERLVSAAQESNADDEHDPEGATIAFERSQVTAHIAHAQTGLAAVDEALARVTTGRYGVCSRCGRPIGAGRLEARPTATACITCARG